MIIFLSYFYHKVFVGDTLDRMVMTHEISDASLPLFDNSRSRCVRSLQSRSLLIFSSAAAEAVVSTKEIFECYTLLAVV